MILTPIVKTLVRDLTLRCRQWHDRAVKSSWTIELELREDPKPWEPELVVNVLPVVMRTASERYAVSVELRYDDDAPRVIGVCVRRHPHAGGVKQTRTPLSLRDVQRLSLRPRVDAAVAFASEWRSSSELREPGVYLATPDVTTRRIHVPKYGPGGGTDFYRQIAKTYRACKMAGLKPAKEIARRRGVPVNTAYQWIYRARELKYLEPSGRRWPRTKGTA